MRLLGYTRPAGALGTSAVVAIQYIGIRVIFVDGDVRGAAITPRARSEAIDQLVIVVPEMRDLLTPYNCNTTSMQSLHHLSSFLPICSYALQGINDHSAVLRNREIKPSISCSTAQQAKAPTSWATTVQSMGSKY
ncbi:hypothetical protein DTO166G4_8224 [Paecilomyces variotii]|nr:hypothetical protein DTO166G4_8224 [Paecilomyces variotii]KAJ9242422.1 hypothetical protein DTO166G5_825 [Paecilomyces variotii]